jgi:CysZ protein
VPIADPQQPQQQQPPQPQQVLPRRAGALQEVAAGVGDLLRGFRVWGTSPRLMLLGAVPAVLVGVVFVVLLAGLVVAMPAIVVAITPFADGWSGFARDSLRAVTQVALFLLSVVLLVLAYTAVTLAVGDPFYERIARRVEVRAGDPPPEHDEPLLAGIGRAVREGLRLFLAGLLLSVALFVVGLIPVVGPVLAAVLGALLGGRLLATELTGYAFEARGRTLGDRRKILRARAPRVIGFGAVTYLLFLVPFAAIVVMPAAVAGATLLAREALGEER